MRIAAIFPALLIAACATTGGPTGTQSIVTEQPARPVTMQLLRTSRTISNQPLRLPPGDAELAAASIEIPAGGATPIHQHPWSRFVYVERGPVRIINHDTGESRDFESQAVLPEVVAQWHEARAHTSPVRLIVIDVVPPGVNNTVMKSDHSM